MSLLALAGKKGLIVGLLRTLTGDDISLFAVMSGDVNPAHVDEEYAKSDMFHKTIAHGMSGGALISPLLARHFRDPARMLLASPAHEAADAVDLFVYRIGRELGSLAAAVGGIDVLVFTAGIGEHAAPVRARVCENAAWLGIRLDPAANLRGGPRISIPDSPVSVWVITTNEELMIARHTLACIRI